MNSKKFVKILSDFRCGNTFGTVNSVKSMRARLTEEGLFPKYNDPVKPVEAARMILYSAITPYVSAGVANGVIQKFEAQFRKDSLGGERDFKATSLGFLNEILSGERDVPYLICIDREHGAITTSELEAASIIDEVEFWPGLIDSVPVDTNWPKSPVIIKGAWLKELAGLIQAGMMECPSVV